LRKDEIQFRYDSNDTLCFFLTLVYEGRSDISIVYTLRGVNADVIYCEEAAYMDLSVFYEVVVPLFEVGDTVMVSLRIRDARLISDSGHDIHSGKQLQLLL
jgi:hypothetical protein